MKKSLKPKLSKEIDAYIAAQPLRARKVLKEIRQIITEVAPEAEEVISYKMPAYKLHGMLVYFAAWKEHIGFYPASIGINAFFKDLSNYHISKGTIHFPLDEPIPYALIGKIVKFRVKENIYRMKEKAMARKK